MIRCILAAILVTSLIANGRTEEAFDRPPPEIIVPEKLQPYLNETNIRVAFENLVLLLQTVNFKDNFHVLSGVVDNRSLAGECNTEEFQRFYRGIQLTQLAYNLFISRVENGWFSGDRAVPDSAFGPPAFSSYGREALLLHLTSKRLYAVMEVAKALENLRPDLKQDLKSFLIALKNFRAYYESLKPVQNEFNQLLLRAEDGYVEVPSRPTKLWAWDFAHEVRLLINKIVDPSKPPISQCFESQNPYILEVGTDKKIEYRRLFTPVKYMVLFWKRRESEGTSGIAELVISKAIAVLEVTNKTGD